MNKREARGSGKRKMGSNMREEKKRSERGGVGKERKSHQTSKSIWTERETKKKEKSLTVNSGSDREV